MSEDTPLADRFSESADNVMRTGTGEKPECWVVGTDPAVERCLALPLGADLILGIVGLKRSGNGCPEAGEEGFDEAGWTSLTFSTLVVYRAVVALVRNMLNRRNHKVLHVRLVRKARSSCQVQVDTHLSFTVYCKSS